MGSYFCQTLNNLKILKFIKKPFYQLVDWVFRHSQFLSALYSFNLTFSHPRSSFISFIIKSTKPEKKISQLIKLIHLFTRFCHLFIFLLFILRPLYFNFIDSPYFQNPSFFNHHVSKICFYSCSCSFPIVNITLSKIATPYTKNSFLNLNHVILQTNKSYGF